MRLKRIATVVVAAAVLMPMAPAQADQASARASFDSIGDQATAKVLNLHPVTEPGFIAEEEAWKSAYAADLVRDRDGYYSPLALDYFDKVYEAAVRSGGNIVGYGKNRRFDAWDSPSDGSSENSINTIYTVTMTDHVGEPLLRGYDAGVVPQARLQEIATALWDMPRYNTGSFNSAYDGKCIAYSNSPYDQPSHTNNVIGSDGKPNPTAWCAINVNIGAAAFLQKLQDRGITPAGASTADVDLLIQQIYDFTAAVRNQGIPSSLDHTDDYQWAYSFKSYDASFPGNNKPQDANHATYTAESLTALHETTGAVALGNTALDRFVANGDHVPNNEGNENDYQVYVQDQKGFDVVGRLRGASLRPSSDQKHLLTEAQWWVDTANAGAVEGHDSAYSWGQIGRWAYRLASTANAGSEGAREITFMSKPRVYNYPYGGSGSAASLTQVKQGQKYTIWMDARFHDLNGNLQFATAQPIRYSFGVGSQANVTFQNEKPSGYEWYGSRFVLTVTQAVGKTLYICSEVTAGQASAFSPTAGCRTVTVIS